MIEDATELVTDTLNDAKEVIKQRFFSPMYFYFILAWIVTNWKFLFALLFVDPSEIVDFKIDFLVAFYPFTTFGIGLWSVCKLILIPALSSYTFVWWLSRLSEQFYARNEKFKINKVTIKRKLDYQDKVSISEEQRKIRDAESDKNEIRYIDHEEFNTFLDESQENITVLGNDYLPSETLYATDPENYKAQLNEYLAEHGKDKSKI